MPKNKNINRQQTRNNGSQTQNISTQDSKGISAKIEANHSKAIETATEEEVAAVQASLPPANVNLEACWRQADEARQIFEFQAKRTKDEAQKAEAARKKSEEERAIVITLKEELEKRQRQLNEKQKELESERVTLNAREGDLLAKERELRDRELDADANFAARNRASLARLDEEAKALHQELTCIRQIISEERVEWEKERRQSRKKLETEIAQRSAEVEAELARKQKGFQELLDAERQQFEEEKQKLVKAEKQLWRERDDLKSDEEIHEENKQAFEKRVERTAARRVEQLQAEINAKVEALEQARSDRDRLQLLLTQREEADRRFGQKSPDEVLEEISNLRREKEVLEQKLARRLSEDATIRLTELELQREAWETERSQLRLEMQQVKINLANSRIAVTELENLRDQKETLEARNSLLKTALSELKAQVKDLTTKAEGQSPFPACSKMDITPGLQTESQTWDDISDLKKFASDLRYRIALDQQTGKQLYYEERDIRAFLGGLAMSHLHILQGISGTGKTSLPLAFARAVGGGSTLLEVQAGWRDRQDLIGHFNAFESRFYESEFLQALYRCQCLAYEDRVYIILLDEMNLSRPEQYFADFLSKLEQDEPVLDLMTAPVEPAPRLFREGRKLSIPRNVWFVGTANQDETTLEFADKTYDRSHVMDLPRNRVSFEIPQIEDRSPVSYKALMEAFANARISHAKDAAQAYEFLQTIEDTLDKCFRVGWGNRLQRQMESFVPVVIASGGTLGEATDHIVATKILRRIPDRHDTQADDLRKLQDDLQMGWSSKLATKTQPERSLAIIRRELHRLGEENI